MNTQKNEEGAVQSAHDAYPFLLREIFSFELACANEVSASKQASKLTFSQKSGFFPKKDSGIFLSLNHTAKSGDGLPRSFFVFSNPQMKDHRRF